VAGDRELGLAGVEGDAESSGFYGGISGGDGWLG
jgi:hypothetical protein